MALSTGGLTLMFFALKEYLDDLRVKMFARLFLDVFVGFFIRPGIAIGVVGCERVEDVHDGEYARGDWYGL